jgi:hypothetical protein
MVTIDGDVVELGNEGLDAAGFDLLAVFIGSEGMLGVVTEVSVKLVPKPQTARVIMASFDDVVNAARELYDYVTQPKQDQQPQPPQSGKGSGSSGAGNDDGADGSASGNIITNYYVLDNGQRDNFYAEGVLYLRSGYSAPAGNVYVDFDYFEHGASGDFFAVNSYTGQVNYEDIPAYRQRNGETVQLRNAVDFRSRKANTAGDFTSTGAVRMEIPANTDLITADVSYYLGQAYRIVIDQGGSFRAIAGERSLYPIYPSTPENSMELYRLSINPYTLNDSDVSLTYVDNRRYTMRDIADLETRMDKIEEITTLNLLELETATLEVLDSNGVNRLKIGLTADNFTDHFQSARSSEEYKASTDAFNRELRPSFVTRSSELVYDSDNSQFVKLIGDTVYPLYEEVLYTANGKVTISESAPASSPTPINQTNLGVIVGQIKLSPSTDTWFDTVRLPAKIIDGGTKIDPANNSLWNDWGFNWSGVSESKLKDNYSETKT